MRHRQRLSVWTHFYRRRCRQRDRKTNADGSAELPEDAGYSDGTRIGTLSETDGAFDIAIYPVMETWGFPTQNFQVPSQNTLDPLLPLTHAGNISYDKETKKISFGVEGMKIDLEEFQKDIPHPELWTFTKRQWNHKWISESWRKCAGTRNKDGWNEMEDCSAESR